MMKCRASKKLNKKQMDNIHNEVAAEFNKLVDQYNQEAALQVLHILHFDFGFGMKRLQRFADRLVEMQAQQKRSMNWLMMTRLGCAISNSKMTRLM